ncbi:MAG: hypothetical protein HZA31_09540 [Opitutae bacterium]|nr:hypothetical protein [Opitutae bacterium]
MTLDDVLACFPTIPKADWEDSYLAGGGQRLLANAERFQVEIMLEKKIQKIAFFFTEVDREILSCVNLVTKDVKKSLQFLGDAAAFITANPDVPFRVAFGDYDIEMTQIQTTDAVVRTLIIRPTELEA